MGEMINSHKILAENLKRIFGRPRRRWEDISKWVLNK
jgi:hypothetical protein